MDQKQHSEEIKEQIEEEIWKEPFRKDENQARKKVSHFPKRIKKCQ